MQRFKAIEPSVEALNGQTAAIQFGVERRVIAGLPVGGTPVARDIGLDATPRAGLPQADDINGFVSIEKQAVQAQLGGFEQFAQLGKDALQLKRVVLVTGLGVATASGSPWLSARTGRWSSGPPCAPGNRWPPRRSWPAWCYRRVRRWIGPRYADAGAN